MALLTLLLPSSAFAQTFPPFNGLVTDAASVLPADRKAALEAKLRTLQQQTNHQLVVATIPDLQGQDIADYGYKLGRAWGVGLKGADNGAILIVAPNERKVRVEVGYGLEPILTDALSSVIINQTIIPKFKAGDMPGGIEAGADALITQLRLPDDQAKAKAAEAAKQFDETHNVGEAGPAKFPIIIIVFFAALVFMLLSIFRKAGGRRYARSSGNAGSDWPIWLWAASEIASHSHDSDSSWGGSSWGGGGSDSDSGGGWGGGGFTGGGGGSFGGGGASGSW
ncbi:TPM domain-containing protein [Sphingomonas sp.]|uniref:TPM domain-containing protein n=1 Tax=Sphingomonas sp. TaxID=28214 RepID=UPI003B3A033E